MDRSREESAERVFDAELDHLLSALSDRRMARLADIPDAVQRARAFAFPLQLERARAGMRKFVEALFEPDPVEEGPLFRGFYLTSAKQEGAPVDRVLQPIASGLGAGSAAWPAAPQVGNGAFFVRDFLTQVVFPDAELATASTRAEARKRRSRVFLFLGLGIALLTFVILLGALSAANGRLINRMRRASRDVAEQVRADAPPMQNLALLEDLRASAVVVDSLARRKPFWRWVSAYSGDALRDPAVQLYVEKSLESLVAPSAREMEATLTRMTDTGDGSFIRYYFLFRAWRLLTEPKQLKLEDAPILAREMRRVIEPRLAYASPSDRQRFPRLLSSQVEFLATHSNWLARLAPAYYRLGNPDLVARATARVRNTWDSGQFYRLMIDETQPQVKPVGLASLVSNPGFLNGSFEVPGLFTREGWQRQIKPQIEWYRVQMQRDWVVADAFRGRPPDLADSLLGYYARDYSANWVRFLTGLGVADPRDMKGAVEMMGAAAQDDSPILKVLHGVADQTSLGADPSSPLSRAQGDFEIVRDFFEAPEAGGGAKRVTSFIARFLQNLKGGSRNALDQSKPPSAHYLDELRDAHKEVLKAAQPDAPASDIKNLMTFGTESSNPVKSALSWVDGLAETYASSPATEPVARLLKLPITGTQQAAKGGLRPELANKWNFLVVQPFQRTLAGKYPLVENGADAALFDFQEFFRPGGTFWSFYEAELKDYVLEDGTSRNPDGSVPFSADFMACLRRAYDLRESFFAGGASAPALKFSVRPNSPEGPALIRMVSLDLGGQYAPYTMGVQQWLPLEWPGTDANAGATLRAQVSSGQQPESLTWPGVWGLFHLLDHAQFGQVEGPTPSATWKLSYGAGRISVTYDIQPSSAAHHPFRPGFLRFALPASP